MNIHPLFVHFPIALLTVYAALEIVRLPVLTRQSWYRPVKAVLLFAGFLGGMVSLQTGEIAEEAFHGTSTMRVVEVHSLFANITMWIYGILSASYLLRWISDAKPGFLAPLMKLERLLFSVPVLVLGAIAGLCALTVTGALGGALVYGPNADPIVSVIYHLFFAQ